MQGYEALWLPGMDHAGIATQNVVERQLAKEGLSRHDLGREAFVERVWQWKAESGGKILGQMRRLGDCVDWTRERFTMDEGLSRAVLTIFKRLYDDGLIYRAERIINWCPRCLTALSDIEVEHSEDDGELVSIRYGDGDDAIVVATTRAETMLGDTAVAVHPDDERYRHLIGTEVELPLTGRHDPDRRGRRTSTRRSAPARSRSPRRTTPTTSRSASGTTCRAITIMDERGVITAARTVRRAGPVRGAAGDRGRAAGAGPDRRGEAAVRARGRALLALPVPRSSRGCPCSGSSTPARWPRRPATRYATAGSRIEPPELAKRYFAWVDNMHDWCISRQLWWGHRIPVWYGPDGEVVCVGPDDEVPGTAEDGWRQDQDVLDTWFSSRAVAVLHAGLAGHDRRPGTVLSDRVCWSPATTSCSSGSPG